MLRARPTFVLTLLYALASTLLVTPAALPLRATSVTPPTFSALTARAETIVRAEVLSTRSELVERAGSRAIFTYVTFRIDEILKGTLPATATPPSPASTFATAAPPTPANTLTLEFLGGTVGELSMDVAGIPSFARGQTDILFVEKNGAQICPLVAMMFGRYRVQRDAISGTEFITRDNGAPLTNLAEIALPFASPAVEARLAAARGSPLTAAAFTALIREEAVRIHTP